MTLIQNYIGLDARIEAIVRALMGDVDVDLTDYYTKEEVDALIASGGTGLQINYNDLLNRPIIDGLMQSNLDLNGHFLLYNSQRLYCPAVIDNIITFDAELASRTSTLSQKLTRSLLEAVSPLMRILRPRPTDCSHSKQTLQMYTQRLTQMAAIKEKSVHG